MDFLSLLFCGHVSQNMDTNYFVLNNFSRYDVGIFKSNFPFFKFDSFAYREINAKWRKTDHALFDVCSYFVTVGLIR